MSSEEHEDIVPEISSEDPGSKARDPSSPSLIVGIGASAGGLEALQKLFTNLPPKSGMAFVVIQHLDPKHESIMGDLLGKFTTMEVQTVSEPVKVFPDHVYMIAPNVTLTIKDGLLQTHSPIDDRPFRAPIDKFFRSLGEDQKALAACVILSGTGSDGTIGLKSIKENGGLTIAQSPATAKYDSMPRNAINTGLVDHIANLEMIPPLLADYVRLLDGLPTADQFDDYTGKSLATIRRLLRQHTGHDFSAYKSGTLLRRVQRRMRVLLRTSLTDYVQELAIDREESQRLFKDLLIGVTHFFRDPEVFHKISSDVIPILLRETPSSDQIRIWVPGCATGEETYSLAILVAEALTGQEQAPRVQIFGTDLDDVALNIARQGFYGDGIADHLTPQRLDRFFIRQANGFLVRREIRDLCLFSPHNLVKDPPFSRLDLVSCRNLLIYWESELQQRAIALFHYSLKPYGFLVLGPSEQVGDHANLFRSFDKKMRIYKKLSDHTTSSQFPLPVLNEATRQPHHRRLTSAVASGQVEEIPVLFERALREEFGPAAVLINDAHEILYATRRTKDYLELPEGAFHNDLVTMLHPTLRLEISMAIRKAMLTHQPVIHPAIEIQKGEQIQKVTVIVKPVTATGDDLRLYMIVFQELGASVDRALVVQAPASTDQFTQDLEMELRRVKEQLQATIEDLQSANEELNASNEELLSMNEELHSTNEELQTSQEELQSVNEELETVNSELRQKVDQLDRANSDIENLLTNTQVAILFLDRSLRIVKFTPSLQQLFRILPSDVGRSLRDIVLRFSFEDFPETVHHVWKSLVPVEQEIWQSEDASWHLMRILPYRTVTDLVDGVIVTFIDITERKRVTAEAARLAAIVDSSTDAILGQTLDGIITTWNDGAEKMFGYSQEEAIGKPRSMLLPKDYEDDFTAVYPLLRAKKDVQPFFGRRARKDGTPFDVSISISPHYDPSGNVIGLAAIKRDVTHHKQIQDECLRLNQQLTAILNEAVQIFDVMPIGILIARDADCQVVTANAVCSSLLEIELNENPAITALSWDQLPFKMFKAGVEMATTDSPVQRAAKLGIEVNEPDLQLQFHDGRVKIISVHALPLKDKEGRPQGCVASLLDVTERQRLLEALKTSNEVLEQRVRSRTETLQQLAVELTHSEHRIKERLATDLHDYLAQTLVFCKIKVDQARPVTTRATSAQLTTVSENLDKLIHYTKSLITDLLPHNLREMGLHAAVQILGERMAEHNLRVTITPGSFNCVLPVETSSVVYHVIRELLSNVVKHAGTDHALIEFGYTDTRELQIRVSDEGSGFDLVRWSKDTQPQRQFGLRSARQRIEAIGGRFSLESRPGHGVRCTIVIPIEAYEEEPAKPPPSSEDPLTSDRLTNVLLVDDHAMVRQGIRSLLGAHSDLTILGEAADGEEAVELALTLSPDIILMDINLPKLNGIEACREIKRQGSPAIVVGLSVNAEESVERLFKEAGGVALLSKTKAADHLYRFIRQVISQDRAR